MNLPQIFQYEGAQVRTVVKDGEPWFVAADICAVLGIRNPSMAVTKLDSDEVTLSLIEGSHRETNVVNESGLYSLIMTSRKAEAKKFKKWVTSEVLPQIRKTGGYGADPIVALNDPVTMRGLLLTYSEKVLQQQAQIEALTPKAEALDRIAAHSTGSMCITDAAKHLQVRPAVLFGHLSGRGWIYRRAGGSGWVAYQSRLQQGVLEHKITTVERSDGSEKVTEQVRVTAKGLAKLAEVLTVAKQKAA